jgi:hypothetical protein
MQDTYIILLCIFLLETSKEKHNKKTTMMCDNSVVATKKSRRDQVLNYPLIKTLLDWKVEDTYNVLKHKSDCVPRNLALAGILRYPELQNLFRISDKQGVTRKQLIKTSGVTWLTFYRHQPMLYGLNWTNQKLDEIILEFLRKTTPLNHCMLVYLNRLNKASGHVMSICRILNKFGEDEIKIVDTQVSQFFAGEKSIIGKIVAKSSDKNSVTGELATEYITNPFTWMQDKFSVFENNVKKLDIYENFSKTITKPNNTQSNKKPVKTKPIHSMPAMMEQCPWCGKEFKCVHGLKIHFAHCKLKPALS